MNQLKRLTWKYFIQQKVKEVIIPILYGGYTLLGLMFFSYFGRWIDEFFFTKGWIPQLMFNSMSTFWGYLCYGVLGALCVIPLVFLIFALRYWIKSNWKKAKQRAKEELKKKGKQRR